MNDKTFNALERRSVILEEKLDVLNSKADLLSRMVSDYLMNCFSDGKAINGDKLIAYANRIQKFTAERIELEKQLDAVDAKFEN